MYEVVLSNNFCKDLKLMQKRGMNLELLNNVVSLLENGETLPAKYQDHALIGNYAGFRECHIKGNWLLVYRINNNELFLLLSRTGSHSDLFGM